jgi:PPP family 3-phenylpropionic acid transporter
MLALAAVSLAAYAGLWPVAGFWAVLTLNLVPGTAQSALMPLGDAVTLTAVRNEGADYGRIRVWGSVTFIIAAAGSGVLLAAASPSEPAGNAVLVLVLAASAVLLVACFAVPPAIGGRGGAARWAALASLARDRRFWLFTAAAAALQSSHQLYYGFGTLYWRTLGFSDAVIGALWAEGVVAEIVLFWQGGRLAARLGPFGLMALGGGAGILRWSLAGSMPGLGAAAVLQLLHAFTFGASHLGAMYFMARTVPPAAAASAQSLYAGLSTGIGSGLVMLAAGRLYAAWGGEAYLFMAALSAVGLAGVAALAATSRLSAPAE